MDKEKLKALFSKAGNAIIDKSGIKDSEAYRKVTSEMQKIKESGSVMNLLKDKVTSFSNSISNNESESASAGSENTSASILLRGMAGEDVGEDAFDDALDDEVSKFKRKLDNEKNPENAAAMKALLGMMEGDEDDEYEEENGEEAECVTTQQAVEQENFSAELSQLESELSAKQQELNSLGTDAMSVMKKAKLNNEIKDLESKIAEIKG